MASAPKQVQFVPRDSVDFDLIEEIADRARKLDVRFNRSRARSKLHHLMNISACHASGNPLRLSELLAADDFNFAHDVFGIERHIDRETGALIHSFTPRYSARVPA